MIFHSNALSGIRAIRRVNQMLDNHIRSLGWALHGAGCLAAFAVVGAYYGFVTLPLNGEMEQDALRVVQLEALNARAPEVRRTYRLKQAELRSLEESVADTLLRLPAKLDEQEFLEQVKLVAQASDIEVVGSQIGLAEQLESYSKAEVTFQCHGSFASICRFLDGISHLPRLTEVARLQIETDKNVERYPVQVTFALYFGSTSHDRSRSGEAL